ncbi:hypothetical protein TAMA11512_04000 [Selenomonas sp. TAMA-11512]|uniref:hypothetical protein n=1 Tax=Selenomonas sp. TAMA-11512 TaxID=3095337 RepID=UPI00308A3620|nr:hypothetical protein TAMA11512_04000 [Selenomonas sp. TAMA-11512]
MKRLLAAALAAAAFWSMGTASEAAPVVPEHIFEWVQSSARTGYFFNRQEIAYGVDEEGFVNFDELIVPTLEVYDAVQIQDVVQKRRWRGESLQGYNNLVGAATYLSFDMVKGTVTVHEEDDLDHTWSPLTRTYPKTEIVIAALPEKSFNRRFYEAILAYEKENRELILSHTTGVVREADKKRLTKEEVPEENPKERKKKEKKEVEQKPRHIVKLLGSAGNETK